MHSRMRFPVLLVALAVLVGLAPAVFLASPAAAGSTLCSGSSYSTCINASFGAGGYETHASTSYWTMYSGHNCTNYAAYRALSNGAPAPSHNLGNAATWDNNAAASGFPVNGVAAVGAIAQWEAYATPAGSAGHVAYVEAVNGSTITVSEDNFSSGPFSWRTITAGEAGWPSHFIHFRDIVATPPPAATPHFIVQRQGTALFAKAGFGDAWVQIASNVADFQVAETRITTRDAANNLYAKEGISGQWYTLADHVDEYMISSNLVVIRQGTKLSAKADLWGPWVQIANDAIDLQVAGTRIGHRDANHELYLNDGLYGPWYDVASSVDEYELSKYLIVQRHGTSVFAKASFADAWVQIASNVADFQVAETRITTRDAANNLYAKEGISGQWYTLADHVDEYMISSNLVVIRQGTKLSAKADLWGPWVQIANDAIDIQVAATRIGHRNANHELYLNDGLYGPWYDVASNVDEHRLS